MFYGRMVAIGCTSYTHWFDIWPLRMAFYLFDDFVRFRKNGNFHSFLLLRELFPIQICKSITISSGWKWYCRHIHLSVCSMCVRCVCIFSSNNVEMVSMAVMLQSDIIWWAKRTQTYNNKVILMALKRSQIKCFTVGFRAVVWEKYSKSFEKLNTWMQKLLMLHR